MNPTPAAIKQFMEGLGFIELGNGGWYLCTDPGKQDIDVNSEQAAFWYGIVEIEKLKERIKLVRELSDQGFLGQWDTDRIVFKYENQLDQLTTPAKQPEQEKL